MLLLDGQRELDQQLACLVDRHHASAVRAALATASNDRLLESCRAQLLHAQGIAEDLQADLAALDAVIGLLEGGNLDGAQQVLSRADALLVGGRECPADADALGAGSFALSPTELVEGLAEPAELQALRAYLARPAFERLRWSKGDYIVVASAVVVGLALELVNAAWRLNSPIDSEGSLRRWFNERFHDHPSGSPMDYQGPGFGGPYHRVRSPGHDLARFLDAVDQTARGEFRGVRWSYGSPVEVISAVNQYGNPYPQMSWTAAFVNVVVHLIADFFSTHSLPLPLTSVIYENCGREMRKFVHELYEEGVNLRHVSIGALQVGLAHLAIEVWLWIGHGSERRTDSVALKRYEMRLATTGMLSGANIAGAAVLQNPFMLNVPTLVAAVDSSVRLWRVQAKRHSWVEKEVRNLDDLLVAWDSLADRVSRASPTRNASPA